ncbi:MAG: serine/threonine-protein kinase [Anaerolineae bacterium]|jgi:outer membrane protein assembly factor BamB/tRNA A-37 threonylcarbamoyl transferase component Bud32
MSDKPLLDRLGEYGSASRKRESAGDGSTDHTGEEPSAGEELDTRHIKIEESKHLPRVNGRLAEETLLEGRYRIRGVLGAGGMSTVYKAQDLRFPQVMRLCAVKEMLNTASDKQVRAVAVRNFEREANILATLSHHAVPQVYDYFSEKEHSYLVMEFIPGKDLETLLKETEGFLPESKVVDWAIQICRVLTYLHYHKPNPVVFRDLKPSNIMLDEQGRIRLVDFGIAKVFQSGKKGTMIGTEGYSPPEQYRGVAEPRGDIYSLGATLHHLLSKQDPRLEPPFSFHERPIHDANPMVSAELEEIVHRALEYDMNQRFSSAQEMRQALFNLRSARVSTAKAPTIKFDAERGPVAIWQFACEDEIRSSPTVADGVVYVGAYDNNLYALDAEHGDFLWKYSTEGGIGSSPCVSEGRIFVGSQDGLVYAINAESGRLLWTCPTKESVYSSPRVKFGHVFFGSDDRFLYAVKASSGRVAWTFEAEAPIRSSPAVGEEAIYFGDEGGSVYCIGVSGEMKWRFRSRRGVISSPLLARDLLYVGSRDWYLYALDLHSGWSVWRHRTGGSVVSSPAQGGSTIFFGSADGEVYSLDAASGHELWAYQTGGQVSSSPAFYEDAIYVGSADGWVYSIDAKTGKLRWRFAAQGPVTSSPCVADDVIYIGSNDRYVYALPA